MTQWAASGYYRAEAPSFMSLARKVATVGTATLFSRLLGFVRDAGIAAVLGAGVLSDAFFAALQIANLFRRLLAEGALNSAFVPMWTRIRDDDGADGARCFGEDVLATMLVALALFALACVALAPVVVHILAPGFAATGERFAHAVAYLRLSVPYVAVAGLVAVVAAILNAEGRVGAAAFGVVAFNGVMILAVAAVALTRQSDHAGRVLSFAVVVAGLAQFTLVAGAAARLPGSPRRLHVTFHPQTRRFFAKVLPGVIAAGMPQLTLMVGVIIASAAPAAVSWLTYASRLYELPLGVVSVAASLRGGNRARIAGAQSRAVEIALALALPAAAAFALLAVPIAGGLFERGAFGPQDTAAVAAALAAISTGLPGHALEKVFGAVCFAREDTRTPMLAALAGLGAATIGALVLFPRYGHVGIATAIAISGWVGATLLGFVLVRRRWLHIDRVAWRRLPRIAVATALMACAIIAAQALLAPTLGATGMLARLVLLIALVTGGLGVYLAGLQLLGVARLGDLVTAVRRGI
jgi:putative peptidoglycan lipid II flippase